MSFSASFARSRSIFAFVSDEKATILISAPSNSLILEGIFSAIYISTSSGIFKFSFCAFSLR